MKGNKADIAYRAIAILFAVGAIGALSVVAADRYDIRNLADALALLAAPCERPIEIAIGSFDSRFGTSREGLATSLQASIALWNEAAGKPIFTYAEEGLPVNLVYSEHQAAAALGQAIDAEQAAYEAKRASVESMRTRYLALVSRYESRRNAFERDAKKHSEEIAYWNARGGAPPGEYERLGAESRSLDKRQEELEEMVDDINALVKELNAEVEELNRLAERTNTKVHDYNERVGDDFDQGNYVEDADGRRINIFEFTDGTELKRLLAHELGHALGLDHVENPDSIMYSYNIGTSFELSDEDRAALASRCKL